MNRDALVITGPTASGKTALSILVAERLGGEVVSMDSRQVYRAMDIGTAKVTAAVARGIPHHGLDLVAPDQRFSAGAFARAARAWIAAIAAAGHVPILVGGTGFFLRALTHPLFHEPELDPGRRERLKRWLRGQDEARLHDWLRLLDPPSAAALEAAGGRQRVSRALEVALLTGRPLSWWHAHAPPEHVPLSPRVFVLDLPRDELYRRIDTRVRDMLAAGLEAEVRELLRRGYDESAPGMNATGYLELLPYLRGETSLEAAVDAIQRATRRYARRQLTWFRHQLPADAVRLDAMRPQAELAEEIARAWREEEVGT
jgi:tRNA dimethylallyltransferase